MKRFIPIVFPFISGELPERYNKYLLRFIACCAIYYIVATVIGIISLMIVIPLLVL